MLEKEGCQDCQKQIKKGAQAIMAVCIEISLILKEGLILNRALTFYPPPIRGNIFILVEEVIR